MKAVGDSPIYIDLMRFKPESLSLNAWAVEAGVSRTVWADMRRHGNPSRRTLERLLAVAGSSLAEFEALRLGASTTASQAATGVSDRGANWAPAGPLPLKLFGTAAAGDWGDPVTRFEMTELRADVMEMLPRPWSLATDPEAFALTVVGDSMWPRFPAGRRIAVSPRARMAAGDDVLVRLSEAGKWPQHVLVKHLVRSSAKAIDLRQFNPDVTLRIDRSAVSAMFQIPGELI